MFQCWVHSTHADQCACYPLASNFSSRVTRQLPSAAAAAASANALLKSKHGLNASSVANAMRHRLEPHQRAALL